MNNNTIPSKSPSSARLIPLWLKLAYTAFMAVLIPVYWLKYGPTNFLYFCDVALLLVLWGIWKESALAGQTEAEDGPPCQDFKPFAEAGSGCFCQDTEEAPRR